MIKKIGPMLAVFRASPSNDAMACNNYGANWKRQGERWTGKHDNVFSQADALAKNV